MRNLSLVLLIIIALSASVFAIEDTFEDYASGKGGLESPGYSAFTITPSDTNPIAFVTRAITCGGAGDLSVEMVNGDTVVFVGRLAGIDYPYRVRSVYNATTMTDCVGLY